MNIENLSLAQIVSSKPEAAGIFESYNLDYCCRGKQLVSDVLRDEPLKHAALFKRLEEIFSKETTVENDFTTVSLSELVNYIVDKHHRYVNDSIPVIKQHLDKVISKHGDKFPHLSRIRELFEIVSNELANHMMKEEYILFPRIKTLEASNKNTGDIPASVSTPIKVMESEHDSAGNLLAEIKKLSNNYTPDENACMTHRVCIDELKMFEEDLHRHVHLENNILFPKAIELENSLLISLNKNRN